MPKAKGAASSGDKPFSRDKTYTWTPKGGRGGALHKRLGTGKYIAHQFGQTVTIYATGMAPNFQTIVKLEMLPIEIFPPEFALFFYDPDIVSPAERPFLVENSFHSSEIIKVVQVHDAKGRHAVKVINF